jgi:HAMP domain-containing protein
VFPLATGAYSSGSFVAELLAWLTAVASRVPGRVGALAGEVRETASDWGVPLADVTDLYAVPARLGVAVGAVALLSAGVVLVHRLRERRRATR